MKKFNVGLLVLMVLMLVLAACGDNAVKEYKPEAVKDTDVCEVCAMDVEDNQHATQIVLKNDKVLMFDDLGDLYVWKAENDAEEIGAEFVRDFHTKEWLELTDATFVYDEAIETPMAYGVISFADKADAEKYVADEGVGVVLTKAELDKHEWESSMGDHDDHGNHDDGDHDHGDHDDHGEHAEGFDMHFHQPENIIAMEEVNLAVELTLDHVALEDAVVRYEIWKEADKDNTDWVDVDEAEAGSYAVDYAFNEAGTYHIQIHVEDDADLHEHMEYEISVGE